MAGPLPLTYPSGYPAGGGPTHEKGTISMSAAPELAPDEARARLASLIVIDVRTPGEYATGHLPGAHNVPLDHLDAALGALKSAADRGELLVVCASGVRSAQAHRRLAEHGVRARTAWAMERQVRLAAGSLVLAGLLVGRRRPAARWLSAGVAGGLVFSAVTDTCGMARVLAKLPHNRPRAVDLDATLAALGG